jgi:hypothetical protein
VSPPVAAPVAKPVAPVASHELAASPSTAQFAETALAERPAPAKTEVKNGGKGAKPRKPGKPR